MEKVLILGAGGHAKVVIATAKACAVHVTGILDDDEQKLGTELFGVNVLSGLPDLHCFAGHQCVVAVGDNVVRRRVFEQWRWRRISWRSLIHPSAVVDMSVTIGDGTVVFAGATLQVDVSVGDHCIINTQASLDHDCSLGDFVHLAPGCHLAGNVTVEDGAFLGIGSSVVPGVRIGKNAVVGAGAVVLRDVPDNTTVVGVPARILDRREVPREGRPTRERSPSAGVDGKTEERPSREGRKG